MGGDHIDNDRRTAEHDAETDDRFAATALVPLSHALTGSFRPYVPLRQLGAIVGIPASLALIALALPTRRALRSRPVDAIDVGE